MPQLKQTYNKRRLLICLQAIHFDLNERHKQEHGYLAQTNRANSVMATSLYNMATSIFTVYMALLQGKTLDAALRKGKATCPQVGTWLERTVREYSK